MKKTILLLSLLVAVAAVWSYRPIIAQQPDKAELKIGLVNVAKVLSECQANLDREKQSREKEQEIKAQLAQMQNEADALNQELQQALEPGSEEFQKALLKWFEKRAQYKAHEEFAKQSMASETQAWLEEFYEILLEEIAQVAHEEAISLILNKDEMTNKPQNFTDLTSMVINRKVLFNSVNLDLTGKLLERMDKLHAMKKAK